MTDDLITFLRTQLDEDERVARAAWWGNGWRATVGSDEVWTGESKPGHTPIPIGRMWDPPTAQFIAANDPTRVLAEVQAKRRILELHEGAHECSTYDYTGDIDNCTWVEGEDSCSTVRLLALSYADRPGYDESWRP